MDHYQLIANSFQRTIETVAASVDVLAEPVEQSSQIMTEALLAGGKIIAVGLGSDAAFANLLVDTLLSNADYERPALPALTLPSHTSIEFTTTQLRALVEHTDIVVLFSIYPCDQANLQALLAAAKDRNARTVLLSNLNLPMNDDNDEDRVLIALEGQPHARAIELAAMIVCCLGGLIENNLFGNFEETNE
jgi:D-sedoheptulose 7-phosphate isomerase